MEITVKVNAKHAAKAADHVRRVIGTGSDGAGVRIEEVFPGLTSGRSAGLVTLELPDDLHPSRRDAMLKTLRADPAVEYAELPSRRSPR